MNTDSLKKEFLKRREANLEAAENKKRYILETEPAVRDLSFRKNALHAKLVKARLSGDAVLEEELREALNKTAEELSRTLACLSLSEEDLTPHFNCPTCEDKGYLSNGEMCSCLKDFIRTRRLEESYLTRAQENASFEAFDETLFSPESEKKGSSQRERALVRRNFLRKFAQLYAEGKDDLSSLYIWGPPGTGKTHALSCIAQYLSGTDHPFLYVSAQTLSELLYTHIKSGESDERWLRIKATPLLLLDDLGTENQTEFITKSISELINERLESGKLTVITSNIAPASIRQSYPERMVSRIQGSYQSIPIPNQPDLRVVLKERSMRS